MRDHAAERLLSLVTSSDRAEAIAGDLAQERDQHGSLWFWLQVTRTTLALWRRAVTGAPVAVMLIALSGAALLTVPAIGGLAAVRLFPHSSGSLANWIALSLFWWGGALGTGVSLVALAPYRGMAACATLAAAGEALLIAVGMPSIWHDRVDGGVLLIYTVGLLTAAPLLIGGAIARRRQVVRRIPSESRR